nr:4Fe-4S binding protein [Lachnospiraceae bacterium]
MDIKKVGDRECITCGECIGECPDKAIGYGE